MRRIIAILVAACVAKAAAAADVIWILPEFPPAFISGPALTGQGYGDRQLKFLIDHLPQFHHTTLDSTSARVWREIETRQGVCTLAAARLPERERHGLFSARPFRGATNQVVIRTDRLPDFRPFLDPSGAIDLALLAADGHLRGGYTEGASYGPAIDAFIRDPSRRTPLEMTPHLRMPLTLLDKGRLDFVFGYYMEMTYYRRITGLDDYFTALPTRPEQTRQDGYVVCSDTQLGRKVIAAVDALLASDETMLAFIEPLRDWYSPADFEAAQKAVKSAGHQ